MNQYELYKRVKALPKEERLEYLLALGLDKQQAEDYMAYIAGREK